LLPHGTTSNSLSFVARFLSYQVRAAKMPPRMAEQLERANATDIAREADVAVQNQDMIAAARPVLEQHPHFDNVMAVHHLLAHAMNVSVILAGSVPHLGLFVQEHYLGKRSHCSFVIMFNLTQRHRSDFQRLLRFRLPQLQN